MASIKIKNLCKIYPNGYYALKNFNLDIEDKEFIIFVGPSGCGKSTTLRMIAGLEEISSGELWLNDRLINDVEPKDRDIAMVFQNYALYPHMNVYENMSFGLKLKNTKKELIDEAVNKAAKILNLSTLLDRYPKELSGGQRQRVAMGRAIVRTPKVFLMDEPLSNLDAKLRAHMRVEISRLHKELGATFIYVTHDQTEAMTLGTRIVVMKDGVIQQIGSPKEIYDNPKTVFVGGFIGSPAMNFVHGKVANGYFIADNLKFRIPDAKFNMLKQKGYDNKEVIFGIRPEDIHDEPIVADTYSEAKYKAEIEVAELLGHESILYTTLAGQQLVAKVDARSDVRMGDTLELALDMNKCHFFDVTTEEVIR